MVRCSSHEARWRCSVTNGTTETWADTAKAGGSGDGFRPHELLEAALASCLNMTARMAAADRDIELDRVRTDVELRRSSDRTEFRYSCTFEGVSDGEAEILRAAISGCPVHETLSKDLAFERVE